MVPQIRVLLALLLPGPGCQEHSPAEPKRLFSGHAARVPASDVTGRGFLCAEQHPHPYAALARDALAFHHQHQQSVEGTNPALLGPEKLDTVSGDGLICCLDLAEIHVQNILFFLNFWVVFCLGFLNCWGLFCLCFVFFFGVESWTFFCWFGGFGFCLRFCVVFFFPCKNPSASTKT